MNDLNNLKALSETLQNSVTSVNAQFPNLSNFKTRTGMMSDELDWRFFRVNELSENKATQYRLAMANVISNFAGKNNAIVYLLSGKPNGVDLYIGVSGKKGYLVSDDASMLKKAFEGNFLGADLTAITTDNEEFSQLFNSSKHIGVVTGVPSFNEENNQLNGEDFQSIERLVNTMGSSTWQMVVVAEPCNEAQIYESLSQIYELSTRLSGKIKYSLQQSENEGKSRSVTQGTSEGVTRGENSGETRGTNNSVNKTSGTNSGTNRSNNGSSSSSGSSSGTSESVSKTDGTSISKNTGTSVSTNKGTNNSVNDTTNQGSGFALTRENINKHFEQIQTHLNETQIERFRQGLSKGMFKTAVYLCADDKETYERLSRGVLAIFQGVQAVFTPLRVHKLENISPIRLSDVVQIRHFEAQKYIQEHSDSMIVHSIPQCDRESLYCATWLNTKELSLLAGLPCLELPGIKLRKSVSFALNTVNGNQDTPTVKLGNIIQDGRKLENKAVEIPKDVLNKHVFVTGVTGAGKTTTCMKLLLESGFPFTVIEPAKTEYRALSQQTTDIQYYSLGREDLTTFRLNPFELVSKHQNLTGHISMLKATMTAVFPMEASMPFIVESAIIQAYQRKGWDITNNTNYLVDDPWNTTENVWPTFSDMIAELDSVIKSAGMGKEFEEKYKGSLVSRLESLTKGIRGTMINTPRSLDFDKLLDQKIVIELDELKDEEDKAFFMGLIIGRLAECMKQRHRKDNQFKHMTLVEEAHRLLSRPEPGADGSKKLGVEMFANLLAEVRKYGECLVIADQIPNKLVSDVIKNTNTKIIHRLFASDDRNSIGDTMSLNDEQKDFLPLLNAGETVIYSGGWHAPVRAQIEQTVNTIAKEIEEDEIKKIGQKQLFELHSKRLFPTLSNLNYFQTSSSFSEAVFASRQMANMLVSISKLANKSGKFEDKDKLLAEKILKRFTHQFQTFQQKTTLSQSQTIEILLAVMKDAQPMDRLNKVGVVEHIQQMLSESLDVMETEPRQFLESIEKNEFIQGVIIGTIKNFCTMI